MSWPYFLNVSLHLFAALLWLGGMFFLAAVGAPVLRRVEPPSLRARLFRALGARFRAWGWGAIAVLVATGVGNLHFRGVLSTEILGSADFWAAPFGRALAWKLGAVTAMIVISAAHDFWLGPAAGNADRGERRADRMRRAASWMARVNAALGVVVVLAAVRLARGG